MTNLRRCLLLVSLLCLAVLGCRQERVVEPGALGPKALLTRTSQAIAANDRQVLIACMIPEQATEQEQQAAAAMADLLLVSHQVKQFLGRLSTKFGRDSASDTLGNAASALMPLTLTPSYGYAAARGEIVIEDDRAAASYDIDQPQRVLQGMKVVLHRHADDRWYLFPENGQPVSGGVKHREATMLFIEQADLLVDLSMSEEEYAAKVAPHVAAFCEAIGLPPRGRLRNPERYKKAEPFTSDAADPRRRAIEWVLHYGGQLQLLAEEPQLVASLADLPEGDFTVRAVELVSGPPVPAEQLEYLQAFPSLESLSIASYHLADENITPLALHTKLRHLRLSDTRITGSGLSRLPYLAQLESLSLVDSDLQDAGLASLTVCRNLTELNLQATDIRGEGLEHLADLAKLEMLNLRRTRTDNQDLAPLAGLKRLRELDLSETRTGDEGLATLAALPNLERLLLYRTRVTDLGLSQLARFASLRQLDLGRTGITDKGLSDISEVTGLRGLFLSGVPLTGSGLAYLKALDALTELDLSRAQLKDYTLKFVAAIDSLQDLNLAATPIGDEGVERLVGMENLRTLNLDRTKITAAALDHLARLTSLEAIHLAGTELSQEHIAALKKKLGIE